MSKISRASISMLLYLTAISAFASEAVSETAYSCTRGSPPVVSVYIKDSTYLFRGNAAVKNRKILRFGGVISGPSIETSNQKDEKHEKSSTPQVTGSQRADSRVGDLQALVPKIGIVAGESELRPGDKVPPKVGLAVGQVDNGYFDASLDQNGEVKMIRWQSWQRESAPIDVAFDPRIEKAPELNRYVRVAEVFLSEFQKFAACCYNDSARECKFPDEPEPETTKVVEPVSPGSFSSASPFGPSK